MSGGRVTLQYVVDHLTQPLGVGPCVRAAVALAALGFVDELHELGERRLVRRGFQANDVVAFIEGDLVSNAEGTHRQIAARAATAHSACRLLEAAEEAA